MALHLSDHFTYGRLLRFTLPSMTMMVFTSIYSVVDGFFVSNYVGKTAFAAVTLIFPLLSILGAAGFMLGAGGAAIVGKLLGEKHPRLACRSFSLFVYATLWPENRVLLFFIIPVKVKWLAWIEAALFIITMIMGRTLLPLVGVANYFLFCGPNLVAAIRLFLRRHSPSRREFRQKVERAENGRQAGTYTRKCAVCGRTDAEYPQLEFRFCSQCVGYHCFCEDHIHSHVHFTQP